MNHPLRDAELSREHPKTGETVNTTGKLGEGFTAEVTRRTESLKMRMIFDKQKREEASVSRPRN